MIDQRCCRREMNENEAGIGGAVEEQHQSAVADSFPAKINAIQLTEDSSGSVDLFSCALKVLSERSPFDIQEEGSTATASTLPFSIASFLSNKSDGKKNQKNSHSKVSLKFCGAEHLRGFNLWDETEEYFRCLKFKDIELLQNEFCSSSMVATSLLSDKHFSAYSTVIYSKIAGRDRFEGNTLKFEDKDGVIQHEKKAKAHGRKGISSSSNLGWLFGCRNKIFATSEWRSSRKRKRSGGDDEQEKLHKIWSVEKGLCLGRCHVCCIGKVYDEPNRLLVCRLCDVVVHQKCYGVCDYVDDSWICSWCKYYKDIVKYDAELRSRFMHKPCVLCPKQGGALKAVDQRSGAAQFAHLFCSLWTPEVYVDNVRNMEPVMMNVGRVSPNFRKDTCYLCEAKNDPCLQCSHGRCITSFHPICGREAGQKFEIWGKSGSDVVELRAFCLKHSSVDGEKIPEDFQEMFSRVECGLEVEETRSIVVDERGHQGATSILKNKDENIMEINRNGGKRDTCLLDSESAAGILKFPIMCNKLEEPSTVNGSLVSKSKSEQLVKAKNRGLLDFSFEDELEGELIYLQHQRLQNSFALKHIIKELISRVVQNLPKEIDRARAQMWDDINAKQCIHRLREAKKRGRKERRQREAQDILAAAMTTASTSTRVSSRKDALDASNQTQDKQKEESVRGVTLVKRSPQPVLGNSKGSSTICDVCRRPEISVSSLLECYGCKVTVHLDCYRNIKNYKVPWYCELCEESCSRSSSTHVAKCVICGGSSGAFRRCKDGRWVHSVCAELVLQSKFRRGQIEEVAGMETVSRTEGVCVICGNGFGICIKCSYGHCQTMFHPYCSRITGLYSSIKKTQPKAYCERHGPEQRSKDESHKYGAEELKNMKQIRVELERLRLLCERIIKREKIKREVVVCSQDILSSRRDGGVISALVQSRFVGGLSSGSATTSLLGSEAVQRSDDSTLSSRHNRPLPYPADPAPRPPPPARPLLAGKKIPPGFPPAPSSHSADESLPEREMFHKEMMLTSDQALMKNRRLPKGYVYVRVPGQDKTR